MIKMIKIIAVLFLVQMLLGCAHQFISPTTGPTAKIKFINNTSFVVLFRAEDNENCERKERYGVLAVVKADTSIVPSEKNVIVYADNTLVFNVQGNIIGSRSITCNMTQQLFVENGKEYEVEFNANESSCFVELHRIEHDAKIVKRIALEAKKNPKYCVRLGD